MKWNKLFTYVEKNFIAHWNKQIDAYFSIILLD